MHLYPRLPSGVATEVFAELRRTFDDHGPEALRRGSVLSHDHATHAATGGTPVPESVLGEVRDGVRDILDKCGWPDAMGDNQRAEFDMHCPAILNQSMQIVPSDAGSAQVWTFMTLLVVPEAAPWRWPTWNERRFLEHPRNTFRNLFWRGFVLGTDGTRLGRLGEDELVAVLERPALSANPEVARVIFDVYLSVVDDLEGVQRMFLMREYAKRLRRLTPMVAVDSLEREMLWTLCAEMLDASLEEFDSPARTSQQP